MGPGNGPGGGPGGGPGRILDRSRRMGSWWGPGGFCWFVAEWDQFWVRWRLIFLLFPRILAVGDVVLDVDCGRVLAAVLDGVLDGVP